MSFFSIFELGTIINKNQGDQQVGIHQDGFKKPKNGFFGLLEKFCSVINFGMSAKAAAIMEMLKFPTGQIALK